MEWNDIHREDRKRINLTEIIKMYSINWTENWIKNVNQTDKWDYLSLGPLQKASTKHLYNTNTKGFIFVWAFKEH